MANIEYVMHLTATWTSIVVGISFISWGYSDKAISDPNKGRKFVLKINYAVFVGQSSKLYIIKI